MVSFALTAISSRYSTPSNRIVAVVAEAPVFVIEILVTMAVLFAGTVYNNVDVVFAAPLKNCTGVFAIISYNAPIIIPISVSKTEAFVALISLYTEVAKSALSPIAAAISLSVSKAPGAESIRFVTLVSV